MGKSVAGVIKIVGGVFNIGLVIGGREKI